MCNTHNHPFVVRAVVAVAVAEPVDQKDWYLYLELFRRDLLQVALAEPVADRQIDQYQNRWLFRLTDRVDRISMALRH